MTRYMFVRHKIKDYAQWKPVFDESESLRRQYGLKRGWICRNVEDFNELTVTLECEDVNRAKQFINSPAIKDAMKRAGVVDQPTIYFLEELADVREMAGAGQAKNMTH